MHFHRPVVFHSAVTILTWEKCKQESLTVSLDYCSLLLNILLVCVCAYPYINHAISISNSSGSKFRLKVTWVVFHIVSLARTVRVSYQRAFPGGGGGSRPCLAGQRCTMGTVLSKAFALEGYTGKDQLKKVFFQLEQVVGVAVEPRPCRL